MNSPLILVFDDLQNMDEISFYLVKVILKYFSNIMVLGVVRTMYTEFSLFRPDSEKK